MTALIIKLPPDLYDRLCAEATRQGKSPEELAREWLTERLERALPTDERERSNTARRTIAPKANC